MGAEADLFNELLFGAGAWIGLSILVALSIVIAEFTKYGGLIFIIIDLFLGIEYLTNVSVNSNFMWSGIIMFLVAILVAYITIDGLRE